MVDFLSQYSIQRWLEMCPQGYLDGTQYGHDPDLTEPDEVMEIDSLREASIAVTVQLIAGERCALAASSGLVNAAPDHQSKTFLATQTLDEARHVEIFTRRLMDLEFHRWLGRCEQLAEMWRLWADGDRQGALAAIPDSLVDDLIVWGTPEQCRDHLDRYVDNGVTTPVIALLPFGYDQRQAIRDLAPR